MSLFDITCSHHLGFLNSCDDVGTLTGEPSNSHDEGPAPQQASSSVEPLSVAASAIPATVLRAQLDESDREREQGSVNTTLTAKDRRVPFYRRKNASKSATSEGALSSTSDPSIIKNRTAGSGEGRPLSRSRPSFLSRVVHRVVPCVSPDPEIFLNDVSNIHELSEPSRSQAKDHSTVEMQQINPENPINNTTVPTPTLDLELLPLAIPPAAAHPPPSPTDSEIIVTPPVSSHLLPEDETDGLTSGAVQPPGSTGEVARGHTHDSSSADESDGTTYTDDEAEERQIYEQDEEERLIKNGGSGIPIGPVRFALTFLSN